MVPAPRGRDLWERRIDRAAQLAAQDESTRPLLVFYGQLLGVQRDGYETFRVARLSGSLETDLEVVRRCASATLSAVSAIGPRLLTDETQQILSAGDSAIDQDRKSTRLNSSHVRISYAVFCLKKTNTQVRPAH